MIKKTYEHAAQIAEWWARRIYANRGECGAVWFYLFCAEEMRHMAQEEANVRRPTSNS